MTQSFFWKFNVFVIVDSILGFLRRVPVKFISIFYRPRPKKIPFFSSCGLDKIPIYLDKENGNSRFFCNTQVIEASKQEVHLQ
jgi:hypothetical protein